MQPTPPIHKPDDAAARPKVLRRPAQFSRKPTAEAVEASPPLVAAPRVLPPAAPAALSWQEDGRFGLTLILVVAATNILLSVFLPLINKPLHKTNVLQTKTIRSNASMPSARSTHASSGVTVYSDPSDQELRDGMSIDRLNAEYNEFETSPALMPAPKARGLSESDQ